MKTHKPLLLPDRRRTPTHSIDGSQNLIVHTIQDSSLELGNELSNQLPKVYNQIHQLSNQIPYRKLVWLILQLNYIEPKPTLYLTNVP